MHGPTPSDESLVALGTEVHALVKEAMALTDSPNAEAVLQRALTELVERQRFLNWVAKHEATQRSGTA